MDKKNLHTQLEIITASFYEHFKFAEDIAKYLDTTDPKRIMLQKQLNKMVKEMDTIRDKIKKIET